MEPVARIKDEHAWIRREMGDIEAFMAGDGLDRPAELRERVRALWIFLLRHERREEEWMSGDWMAPPGEIEDAQKEQSRREHGDIMSVLDSIGTLLVRFERISRGGSMPSPDRQSVRSSVEGLFRFVREHLDREDERILGGDRKAPGVAVNL